MTDEKEFVDYYEVLQVGQNCDSKLLDSAYRFLAKMYHPDHSQTANTAKFTQLNEAYNILRDPEKRADYDKSYLGNTTKTFSPPPLEKEFEVDQRIAAEDADMHDRILLCLYKRRREHAYDAGIVGWTLREMLDCSDDNFEFHVWYLKSKGFIAITEQGTLAVTIQGVDHVISLCRTSLPAKLLITQSSNPQN